MQQDTSTQGAVLDETKAAEQLGITTDQVVTFCQQQGLSKQGDHYQISGRVYDQLARWAQDQGFTRSPPGA